MSINGLLFLFFFLPLSLAVYFVTPAKAKEFVLLILSLVFYAISAPEYFLLFVLGIAVTVALGRWMAQVPSGKKKQSLLIFGILLNAGMLAFYKYIPFLPFLQRLPLVRRDATGSLLIPLGISFYSFKAISYLADVYRGKAELAPAPLHDALYLCFFPQVLSGPISRYGSMTRACTRNDGMFSHGVFRFLVGFCKKVLIANTLANITNEVFAAPFASFSSAYAWLGAVSYSLQLFYDFAGYSDMAIGLSEMFGYNCMENFLYPYMTDSVAGFWHRWHISLSQWFRDYIYIPLGGSRVKNKLLIYRNLLAVWVLTGIWHGASLNYVAWGLGFFLLIAFERFTGLPNRLPAVGKQLYRIFALFAIVLEWVLFRANGLKHGLGYILRMFVPGNPSGTLRAMFLIRDYQAFLIAAIVFSFPVVPWLNQKLEARPTLHRLFEAAISIAVVLLFIWAISFVVAGQNNPFAYANF